MRETKYDGTNCWKCKHSWQEHGRGNAGHCHMFKDRQEGCVLWQGGPPLSDLIGAGPAIAIAVGMMRADMAQKKATV